MARQKNVAKNKAKIIVKPPKDLPILLVVFLFLLTTFIFFADQILMNSFFWEDFVEYVFPMQAFAAKSFAHGEIPFWNPYTFGGMPFLADLQVGFFYLFNRLLSLFTLSGNNLPILGLEIIIILHFFISQINTYALARYFKVSSYGALISAVSYSFSMFMVGHVIHPMIVYQLAWLPLVLMLFVKAFDTKKIFYAIIAGAILGMAMLSGHPQTTLYVVTLLGLVGLYQLFFLFKNSKFSRSIVKAILIFFIPFVIAVGIFAIQYLPSKELSRFAQRNEVSYTKATEGALQFKQIYTAIVPKLFGWVEGSNLETMTFYLKFNGNVQRHFFWETVYYFGIVGAVLGLFGALVGYRSRYVWLMIILTVFGFLYAQGEGSPIFNILYNLPYFGIFRNPGRMMFFVTLGVSILAGFGFDFLWKEAFKKGILIRFIIPLLIAFFIGFLASTGFFANLMEAPFVAQKVIEDSGNIAIIFVIIIGLIGILVNRAVISPSLAGLVLFVLAFIDLFLVGASFNRNPENPEKAYELKPELKAMLVPNPPKDIFRVSMRLYEPIRFMAMQRNQGLLDNVMLIEGYNPLILERVLPPSSSAKTTLDLCNVKYEVKVDLDKGTWAFAERTGFYPRIWAVNDYKVVESNKVSDFMKNNDLNYRKIVVLEKQPNLQKADTSQLLESKANCEYFSNNYIKFRISSNVPVIAVISEIWYPDWKAYVDGRPTEVYRANYSLRAVEVPKGEHIIEMQYESKAFTTGLYLTLATILIVIIGLVLSYRLEIAKHIHIEIKEHTKG
jgi:hypothetical protein